MIDKITRKQRMTKKRTPKCTDDEKFESWLEVVVCIALGIALAIILSTVFIF